MSGGARSRHAALLAAAVLAGCGDDPVPTVRDAGATAGDAAMRADATVHDAGVGLDVRVTDSATQVDASAPRDSGVSPDLGLPVDPGLPNFGDTIDTLTVDLRTGYGAFDGTDSNQLSICLTDTDCVRLNIPNVDDFRRGELDSYTFEGLNLPRADVDRVEIRSVGGSDLWRPNCLALTFDGEPVYCMDQLGMSFGEEANELTSWRDPDNLHRRCDSCYPAPLTHGPLLGAVTPTGAQVMIRTDATRRVEVYLALASAPADSRLFAYAYPSASRDFTTPIHFTGLQPDTEYAYFVLVDGELQDGLHRFTTAPLEGATGSKRIAFGSCSKADDQPIFEHIRAAEPDLFLFVGDNHYANSDDLNALRWFYRWGLTRAGRAELQRETPVLATWDDHDYVGNNTDGTAPGKDVALRVFKEYWANPSAGTPTVNGVFFNHRWGDIELFFVDDRYWRGLDGTMLGAGQTAWLEQALLQSNATFKLIICGSQWTAAGSNDSWASFLPARNALFDFMRDNSIEGVVLLSGDVHRSELRVLPRTGAYDLPEIVSSPLATTNSVCRPSSEVSACFDDDDYFVTLDIDTTLAVPSLTARIVDEFGRERASTTILRTDLE